MTAVAQLSQLPYWVQLLQALTLPAIAALGLGIAFMQWRTAHKKVLFELFDKRLSLYEELTSCVTQFQANSEERGGLIRDFYRLSEHARFLFGDDVIEILQSTVRSMQKYHENSGTFTKQWGLFRDLAVDDIVRADRALDNFYHEFTEAVLPYIRLDIRSRRRLGGMPSSIRRVVERTFGRELPGPRVGT